MRVKLRPARRFAALLLPLAAILGCGSSAPITPPSASPNLSGNWQFQIQSSVSQPLTLYFDFLGALNVQGSAATGTFRVSGNQLVSSCVASPLDIPFTGSIDSSNLLTLTSAPFSGSVATLHIQLPITANGIANGTATVAGGACDLPSAVLLGILAPPIDGTYTGTFTPFNGTGGPATLTFTQSSANSDGQFPVTANLSFNSPTCALTATLSGVATGLSLDLNASFPGNPSLLLNGGLPLTGSIAPLHLVLIVDSSSACGGGFSGNFTSQ